MKRFTLALLALVVVVHAHAITYINTAVTYSSSVSFIDDIVINSTGTLTISGCTIDFVGHKQIKIMPGGKLIGTNATLDWTSYTGNPYSQWQGIVILGLSSFPSYYTIDFSSVTVKQAVTGIYLDFNDPQSGVVYPAIRCINSTFSNNSDHVVMYAATTSQTTTGLGFTFDHCNFLASTGMWPVIFSCGYNVTFTYCTFNQGTSCGRNIHIDSGHKIRINHCTFNPSQQSSIGLHFSCDDAIIDNNQFIYNSTVGTMGVCTGIYSRAGVEFCEAASSVVNVTNTTISNNTFNSTVTSNTWCGILFPSASLTSCDGVNITANTFTNLSAGVSISSCSTGLNYVQKNTFTSFDDAIITSGTNSNLEISCNSFTSSTGNGIQNATGTLKPHTGSDRMNLFYGTFTHIWNGGSSWSYSIATSNPAPPTITVGPVTFNTGTFTVNCSGSRNREGQFDETNAATLLVYPNPGNGAVQITLPNEGESTVHVYDPSGRLLLESKAQDRVFDLDLTTLPKGIYLLLIDNGGTTYHEKIVIE